MYFKKFREYLGLTQIEMSEKLNISQTALVRYELGKVNAGASIIKKYITVFNANPTFLFKAQKPELLNDFCNIDTDNLQLLNELGFLMEQSDINKLLKNAILEQIINKFDNNVSLYAKFLSLLEPERPLLFLYYIVQMIDFNLKFNNNPITNHIEYLCSVIKQFPDWKLFINKPIFTLRIQNKFIEIIKTKLDENECQMIINNSTQILELLEMKLPSTIISKHKQKSHRTNSNVS